MPAPHRSVFAVRIPFLLPNQQRQSTESRKDNEKKQKWICSETRTDVPIFDSDQQAAMTLGLGWSG